MFNNVQTPSPTEAAKTEIIRLFQIESDLRSVFNERNRFFNGEGVLAAIMSHHLNVNFAGGDVAENAVDRNPVGAVEALGANIDFRFAAAVVAVGLGD